MEESKNKKSGYAEKISKILNCKTAWIIYAVLLVVISYAKVNKGVDITDTAYNYGNYRFLDKVDIMWLASTFLSNVTGAFFTLLPFGKTLLGLNIYTGLFKVAVALTAYFFLTGKIKISPLTVFCGEFVAVCLCWCPTSLIYNYLTYLLFLLGAILLYTGLTTDKKRYLVIAGVCLGVNVFVRFPNLCEAALILALWYYSIIKKEKLSECINKTFLCLAGYVGSIGIIYLIFGLIYGFDSYFAGIIDLFSMTGEANQYAGTGMIMTIYYAYRYSLYWFKIVIIAFVAAFLLEIFVPEKLRILKNIIYVVMSVIMMALLYRMSLFDTNYTEYNSIYRIGALVMIMMLMTFIPMAFIKKIPDNIRLLAVICIGVIGITPLGTNNEIYSNLNNLFLIFPFFLYTVTQCVKISGNLAGIKTVIVVYLAVFTYQAVNFGTEFVFRDGQTAPMDTYIEGNEVTKGVLTNSNNAQLIHNIETIIRDAGYDERMLLTYGDVSGMSFYLDMRPAISSTWASLPSYIYPKFEREICRIDDEAKADCLQLPVIIVSASVEQSMKTEEASPKEALLYDFIENHDYGRIYYSDVLCMYFPE